MDVSSVSLHEVLAAASTRAASLVPETSGYLALAIADASARLPFKLDDTMVTLTTEGTVAVARGTQVVDAEESSRRMRDVLARLCACSIGSAPALAAASRPRSESSHGIEGFIRELEAALVPVNRAAARRALARLARETARAREGGKLRRRRSRRMVEERAEELSLPPQPPPGPEPRQAEPRHAAPREPTPPIHVEIEEVPISPPPREIELTPRTATPAFQDEAATTIDAQVAEGPPRDEPSPYLAEPEKGARKRKRHEPSADVTCNKSDVDDLLNRFGVSSLATPDSMQKTRASLKRLAGLDPTPPPPSAQELRRMTAKPPAVELTLRRSPRAEAPEMEAPLPLPLPKPFMIALVALGLLLAGLVGHYLPGWLDELRADSGQHH
jgi:hypothetical protein